MVLELENLRFGTELLKRGFAKMQKGGVIMDVTTPQQATIAEEAGAVAVMALHAVPADIRKMGGVARMADPAIIEDIINSVTIPVMAKARIGHFGTNSGGPGSGHGGRVRSAHACGPIPHREDQVHHSIRLRSP